MKQQKGHWSTSQRWISASIREGERRKIWDFEAFGDLRERSRTTRMRDSIETRPWDGV